MIEVRRLFLGFFALCMVVLIGCGGGAGSSASTTSSSSVPVISSFAASTSSLTLGGSLTLSWSVSGATSLSIDQGVGTVTGSSVSVTPSATGSITYTLTATNSAGSSTASTSVTVSSATLTATSTSLASSATSVSSGSTLILTATVSPSAATGTVTFYDGSASLGTASLSSGVATLSATLSSTGSHSLTATYGGSSNYASSTASAVTVSVSSSLTASTTTLGVSSTSLTAGDTLTLTATVSPESASGTVTFYAGSTVLGTATLSGGSASLTTTFSSSGTYSLTAVYGGDGTYASSTSDALGETVTGTTTGTSTTTSLATASSTAYPGSLVALSATVSPSTATGTVTFYSGSTVLGSATLSGGSATLSTHFTATGSYTLTATYGGDTTYVASSSGSVSQTVASGSYSLDLSSYSYSTATVSVTTDATRSVTYRLYPNVVYAADPVDKTYQSMNIFIPTSVAGSAVSGMPILFDIGVGGYMSCSTWGGTSVSSTNGQYALGKGYVVVEVGCRGRDNGSSGNYYGKAPAAMVDLKAAVRFLRYNASLGTFSGDTDHIISSGGSAGGALSSLLGASGNSSLYDSYLAGIGAADAKDQIFAVGAWSPITDLDHADMAYEWEYGSLTVSGSSVNSTVSASLQTAFETYQTGLGLTGLRDSYGSLTADNILDYIRVEYLQPSAATYLAALSSSSRTSYLSSNTWITWDSSAQTATFAFSDYLSHIGSRSKSVPAFDAFFDLSSSVSGVNTSQTAEVLEFGSSSTAARHFTDFSSEYVGSGSISSSMQTLANMMNPMYYIGLARAGGSTSGLAKYWYIRDGTTATDTSAIVIVNLATSLEDLLGTGEVDAAEDWDTGHNVNTDPGGFSTWVSSAVAAD
nr:subtype B tannase [uncultured Holophaga sp.]